MRISEGRCQRYRKQPVYARTVMILQLFGRRAPRAYEMNLCLGHRTVARGLECVFVIMQLNRQRCMNVTIVLCVACHVVDLEA